MCKGTCAGKCNNNQIAGEIVENKQHICPVQKLADTLNGVGLPVTKKVTEFSFVSTDGFLSETPLVRAQLNFPG
jgi:hypothetical protein